MIGRLLNHFRPPATPADATGELAEAREQFRAAAEADRRAQSVAADVGAAVTSTMHLIEWSWKPK